MRIVTVPIHRVRADRSERVQDLLAVEEPLEIAVRFDDTEKVVAITMRTPGNDTELAAGFLFTEGILENAGDIRRIVERDRNRVLVSLARPPADLDRLARNFYTSSSCGVCGKASIQAIQAAGCFSPPRETPRVDIGVIGKLPALLRSSQAVFEHTGALHASALFDTSGALLALREDVGRHNALDKLIGAELLAGRLPAHERILLLSGRASFELIQKAVAAGIAVVAAIGAPSSLACQTAQRFGITLAGFVREERLNVYSGEWRLGL